MHDRRSLTRWKTGRQIQLRLGGAENFTEASLRDVNLKGAQVSLDKKLPGDNFIKINFLLSSEFILEVETWVVWHKKDDGGHVYGLYFSKIKDEDKERLYKFFRHFIPQQIHQRWWRESPRGGEVRKMASENFEDRRIFERFPVKFPSKYLDGNTSQEGVAQVSDISAKGLHLVLSGKELPVNTPLEIWLEIPDKGEPLYSRGEVVWSKSTGSNEYHAGINLQRADLMGLSRVLRACG